MNYTVHILNGDALALRFPADIDGERIIFREALMDGPVKANSLKAFFSLRAYYLSFWSKDISEADYFEESVPQLQQILDLPLHSTVYLWFEEDLFCQVNLWWILHQLRHHAGDLWLVRPDPASPYSFAGCSNETLFQRYQQAERLPLDGAWAELWPAFRDHDLETLLALARTLGDWPFLVPAVQAHLDRFPDSGESRPMRTLRLLHAESSEAAFGPIFQAFSRREAIYGMGDLQVKALYERLLGEA